MDDMLYISRIDQEEKTTHGWQVRFRRKNNPNKHVSKFFSDSKYEGSAMEALMAAQVWRDDALGDQAPLLDRTEESAKARTNTGIPGVHLYIREVGKKPDRRTGKISKEGKRYHVRPVKRTWRLKKNDAPAYVLIQANWPEVDPKTGEKYQRGRSWSLETHDIEDALRRAVFARGNALHWDKKDMYQKYSMARRKLAKYVHQHLRPA